MHFYTCNGRVINGYTALSCPALLAFDDFLPPLHQRSLTQQIGHDIGIGQIVQFFVYRFYLVTKHSQIEHLDKMRNIQPGGFHICLVLATSPRLILVTLRIVNLRSLEPLQEVTCLEQRL